MKTAARNTEVLQMLKLHIGMGLEGERSEDNSIDLQVQIAEIDAEFRKMLDRVSTETVDAFDEETATRLMNEKSRLQQQLGSIADAEQRRENAKSRLGKFEGISKHICLVFISFLPVFYLCYIYYFGLLIFCCQFVATSL